MVSTSIGAEGLPVPEGEAILIADDPAAFAGAVVSLLESPEFRDRIATCARELMVGEYSWTTSPRVS